MSTAVGVEKYRMAYPLTPDLAEHPPIEELLEDARAQAQLACAERGLTLGEVRHIGNEPGLRRRSVRFDPFDEHDDEPPASEDDGEFVDGDVALWVYFEADALSQP